jgi:anti-sigma B factor antagonist
VEEQTVGPDLQLSTDLDGPRAIVSINGELDAYSAPGLEEEVGRLIASNVTDLVFDLSGTDFLDSSGLRAILTAQHTVTDREGRLALRNPSNSVRRLLDIAGLTEQFIIES